MSLRAGIRSSIFVLLLSVSLLSAAPQQSTENQKSDGSASPACAVTLPNGSQPPVSDFGGFSSSPGPSSPRSPNSHGNGKLWTVLPSDGNLLLASDDQGKLAEKWLWYRTVNGHLSISGRRLDGPGNFETGPLEEIVNGRDTGLLVNGLVFPSKGCWQITGSAGGAQLTFTVDVHVKR
jgi:hypothetical protein